MYFGLVRERRTLFTINILDSFRLIRVSFKTNDLLWEPVCIIYAVVMCVFTASTKRAIEGRVNHYFKSAIQCICNKSLLKHFVKFAKLSPHGFR